MFGRIAAGQPLLAQEQVEDTLPLPRAWVRGEEVFLLKVSGESMAPLILPGDLVMVRVQRQVERGEIAVVLVGEEATLKRVFQEAGGLVLKGDNPDFTPLRFSGRGGRGDGADPGEGGGRVPQPGEGGQMKALSRWLAPLRPGRACTLVGRAPAAPGGRGRGLGCGPGRSGLRGGRGQPLRPLSTGAGGPDQGSGPSRSPLPGPGGPGLHLPPTGASAAGGTGPGTDPRRPGAAPGAGEPVL